jgi:hypothetical protein
MISRNDEPRDPTRRAFLKKSGTTGVAVLGASAATTMLAGCPEDDPEYWMDSHRRLTLEALADAAIPNEGIFTGGDGAKEARALEIMFDPYYASNGWIDEAISELDYYYPNFKNMSRASREAALDYLTTYSDPWYASDSDGKYRTIFQGLILLSKLAWFGGVASTAGYQYLGFPGRSGGYTAAGGSTPAVGTASGNWYQPSPLAIPSQGTVDSWVYVSGTGTVRDLAVTVVLQHTYRGDLVITLYSPAGTAHTLLNRSGGDSDDWRTVNTKITTFDNQTAQGWWCLRVYDAASGDSGYLHQFGLHITAR